MFGSSEVYNALNVSSITDLLESYLTGKALFNERLIPQDFSGTEVINFFLSSTYNPNIGYDEFKYTINCRSWSFSGSQTMANTVVNEINRTTYTDYIIYTNVLGTLPPLDDTDVYNTPIQITVKKR